jgi:hypothetical protein
LQVYLVPAAAFGQWRSAGELFWRNSGELVGGLPADNYIVEIKSVTDYYDLPGLQVSVLAGQTQSKRPHASSGQSANGNGPSPEEAADW